MRSFISSVYGEKKFHGERERVAILSAQWVSDFKGSFLWPLDSCAVRISLDMYSLNIYFFLRSFGLKGLFLLNSFCKKHAPRITISPPALSFFHQIVPRLGLGWGMKSNVCGIGVKEEEGCRKSPRAPKTFTS